MVFAANLNIMSSHFQLHRIKKLYVLQLMIISYYSKVIRFCYFVRLSFYDFNLLENEFSSGKFLFVLFGEGSDAVGGRCLTEPNGWEFVLHFNRWNHCGKVIYFLLSNFRVQLIYTVQLNFWLNFINK